MKIVSRLLAGVAVLVLLLALVLWLFPWNLLRGPVNRYVSEKTGRHFEITRRLDVKLGRVTRVILDGVEFANPPWAKDPDLVTADAAEVDVRLLPLLLHRRIELPRIALVKPRLGLEMLPDGRRTWAFGGKDSGDPHNVPSVGTLEVDQGTAHFLVPAHAADIRVDFGLAGAGPLPLAFQAKGHWEAATFDAQGRTASVLSLERQQQDAPMPPFPVQLQASAGTTRLSARGQIASLSSLEGADMRFDLKGRNLADLYHLLGVVLPETPRFEVSGEVHKAGEVWQARHVQGRLGVSDIGGDLDFDRGGSVPVLRGTLASRSLDFDDLAPLVGLPEQPRSAGLAPASAAGQGAGKDKPRGRKKPPADPGRKLLPDRPIDLARLKAMDADVHYVAQRISHVRALPLDRMSTHVVLHGGVLQLDPLEVGVAGGTLDGKVRIDGGHDPAAVQLALDAHGLQLARLFPGVKLTKESLGAMEGNIDLKGRGNTVAQMLGSSNGKVDFVMGSGRVSNLVMEFAGLDGGEILKFLAKGDRQIPLRCAAASFEVTHGLMRSRALMLDTTDTLVRGDGSIDLGRESLDLVLRAYPKDMSVLAFRSPLTLTGTFAAPHPGVKPGPLVAKAGLALALGAINPLLALAATVETGPGRGHDANCAAVLRDAASPETAARVGVMDRMQQRHGTALGAGPAASAPAAPRTPPAKRPARPAASAAPAEPPFEPAGGMWKRD